MIKSKENHVEFIKDGINSLRIDNLLENPKVQGKIKKIQSELSQEICDDHPNAFSHRKRHEVSLPYEDDFKEAKIPTKARSCQMNSESLKLFKEEIISLQ